MEKNIKLILSALFITVVMLLAEDITSDMKLGATHSHVIIELLIALVSFVGVVFVWKDLFLMKANLTRTQNELEKAKTESKRWIEKNQVLIKGLGSAIDLQMEQWELTASEKEITLLLLKGLSMKEIADIRHTAERTVRQQSLAIYTKSSLSGRAELSAFFLEDLLGSNMPNKDPYQNQ